MTGEGGDIQDVTLTWDGEQPVTEGVRATISSVTRASMTRPARDPESYFHSIRQWAIWTDEKGYDEAGFVDAFVDNTRGNADARNVEWTSGTEELVRNLAADRWSDVSEVLEAAGAR